MKCINQLHDLEPYGIHMLTGEACAYSHRCLCDVDLEGYRLLCDAFGLPYHYPDDVAVDNTVPEGVKPTWDNRLQPPGWGACMNSGVASIKLTYDSYMWIGVHALLTVDRYKLVVELRNKLNRNDPPGSPTGAATGLLGINEADRFASAPYDWETGKYTGEPATLHLPHWTDPIAWFDCNGVAPGRTYTGPSCSQPHRGGNNVHAFTGRTT